MDGFVWLAILFFILFIASCGAGFYLLYYFSRSQKHKAIVEGEYSLSTLFLPWKKGISLRDGIMMFFVSPYFWIIEFLSLVLFATLLLAGLLLTIEDKWYALMLFFSAGFVSFAFSFVYLVIIWLADYKEREPLRFLPTLFLWGCVAGLLAAIIETSIEVLFGVVVPADAMIIIELLGIVVSAPFIEEFIKGFGVLVLSHHHEFNGVVDGAVYGFIIGAGFAFVEDWGYYLASPPHETGILAWIGLVALRSIFTGFSHGVFTGFGGAIIGLLKEMGFRHKWIAFPFIVLLAGTLHMIFNGLAMIDGIVAVLLNISFMPFCVLTFAGLLLLSFALLLKRAIENEKHEST